MPSEYWKEKTNMISDESIEKDGMDFLNNTLRYRLTGRWPDEAKNHYYAQSAKLTMNYGNKADLVILQYSKVDDEVSIEWVGESQSSKLSHNDKGYPDCAFAITLFLQRAFMDETTTLVKIRLSESTPVFKCLQGAMAVPFGMTIKVTKADIDCTVTRRMPDFYAERAWDSLRNIYQYFFGKYDPYKPGKYAMDSIQPLYPMLYAQYKLFNIGESKSIGMTATVARHGDELFSRLHGGSRFDDEQQLYAVALLFEIFHMNRSNAGLQVILYTDVTTTTIAEGLLAALNHGDIEHFHILSDEMYKVQLAK